MQQDTAQKLAEENSSFWDQKTLLDSIDSTMLRRHVVEAVESLGQAGINLQ